MKKSHAFILALFLGIINAFANDAALDTNDATSDANNAAPNCSQYSNPDDNTFPGNKENIKQCRNVPGRIVPGKKVAGKKVPDKIVPTCMFKFNTPADEASITNQTLMDQTGECIPFVKSECLKYENENDCYSDPQCIYDIKSRRCLNNNTQCT